MRKLLLFTGLMTLLIISCNQNKQKGVDLIKGKTDSGCNEIKFEWFKEHSADMKPKAYLATVDSLGNFEVEIPIQQLSKGMMTINNERYDLALIPNDQINISITKDSISYSGTGAEKNNFLYELSKNKKCSKMDMIMSWYQEEQELNDFYEMIEEYVSSRTTEFEKFSALHTLEEEFIDFFSNETQLDYIEFSKRAAQVYSQKTDYPLTH